MAGVLTRGSPAALGLKRSSRLLKRFMRLTGRLMSAVVTSSRQLRRTKAMQGSTSHSKRVWICMMHITITATICNTPYSRRADRHDRLRTGSYVLQGRKSPMKLCRHSLAGQRLKQPESIKDKQAYSQDEEKILIIRRKILHVADQPWSSMYAKWVYSQVVQTIHLLT